MKPLPSKVFWFLNSWLSDYTHWPRFYKCKILRIVFCLRDILHDLMPEDICCLVRAEKMLLFVKGFSKVTKINASYFKRCFINSDTGWRLWYFYFDDKSVHLRSFPLFLSSPIFFFDSQLGLAGSKLFGICGWILGIQNSCCSVLQSKPGLSAYDTEFFSEDWASKTRKLLKGFVFSELSTFFERSEKKQQRKMWEQF